MKQLTTKQYWESGYQRRNAITPININGYKNYCDKQIFHILESTDLSGKNILEVGGGGSGWIVFLAHRYPDSMFTVIDYSEEGCSLVDDYARQHNLDNIKTICTDAFTPGDYKGRFDIVYSHGVVEHFNNLSNALSALSEFLVDNGKMVTFIPNMAGILGLLTKLFNKDVYDIHVPHDKYSFKQGHIEAGLNIIDSNYICSNNFGVLSSCFNSNEGWGWNIYKHLSRLSKVIWAFETKIFSFPSSRYFSPYIYAIAEINRKNY
jgi:2-polyprenyl-3-methyl-5-hydroxy-6-metoxy-1,4-benzoquinol methylase